MIDLSYVDLRLLFPNLTEAWVLAIEAFVAILNLVTVILMVIGEWKLFKKFGEKSWKSLIPFYNTYILYKYAWSTKSFAIYFFSAMMFNVTQMVNRYFLKHDFGNTLMSLLILICLPFGIATAVCSILYSFRLAEAFGKGKGFSVGLLLAYPIFVMILGYGKAEYIGNCDADQTMPEAEDLEIKGGAL